MASEYTREIILSLIKEYYSKGLTTEIAIPSHQRDASTGKTVTKLVKIKQRTAIAFNLRDDYKDYSDEEAEKFNEKERKRIADQLLDIARISLETIPQEKKMEIMNEQLEDGFRYAEEHKEKIEIAKRVFFKLGIISILDSNIKATVLTSSGINIGDKIVAESEMGDDDSDDEDN